MTCIKYKSVSASVAAMFCAMKSFLQISIPQNDVICLTQVAEYNSVPEYYMYLILFFIVVP